jgi:hypothetical protein
MASFWKKTRLPEQLGSAGPPSQWETVDYVLFQIRDDNLEDIQMNLPAALDFIVDCDGLVESIMSSVVCAVFKDGPKSRERPVETLLNKLGTNVRAVYGRGEFLRGNIGSAKRFTYGTTFTQFDKMLEVLLRLEFGSSEEIAR